MTRIGSMKMFRTYVTKLTFTLSYPAVSRISACAHSSAAVLGRA